MRRHEQARAGSQRSPHILGRQCAIAPARDDCHLDAAHLEVTQRTHHRVVLDAGRHHVIARTQQTVQRDVQRMRRVVREHDAARVAGVEQLREELACLFDDARCRDGQAMAGAAGIAAGVGKALGDCGGHLRRLRP